MDHDIEDVTQQLAAASLGHPTSTSAPAGVPFRPSMFVGYHYLDCPRNMLATALASERRPDPSTADQNAAPVNRGAAITGKGDVFERNVVRRLRDVDLATVVDATDHDLAWALAEADRRLASCPGNNLVYVYQVTLEPARELCAKLEAEEAALAAVAASAPSRRPLLAARRMKPDLLRCSKTAEGGWSICVIDVKSANHVTDAHRMQVAFYAMAIPLECRRLGMVARAVAVEGTGEVWRADGTQLGFDQGICVKETFHIDRSGCRGKILEYISFIRQHVAPAWLLPEHDERLRAAPFALKDKCEGCPQVAFCRRDAATRGGDYTVPGVGWRDIGVTSLSSRRRADDDRRRAVQGRTLIPTAAAAVDEVMPARSDLTRLHGPKQQPFVVALLAVTTDVVEGRISDGGGMILGSATSALSTAPGAVEPWSSGRFARWLADAHLAEAPVLIVAWDHGQAAAVRRDAFMNGWVLKEGTATFLPDASVAQAPVHCVAALAPLLRDGFATPTLAPFDIAELAAALGCEELGEWSIMDLPLRPQRFEDFVAADAVRTLRCLHHVWRAAIDACNLTPASSLVSRVLLQPVPDHRLHQYRPFPVRPTATGDADALVASLRFDVRAGVHSTAVERRDTLASTGMLRYHFAANDKLCSVSSRGEIDDFAKVCVAQLIKPESRVAVPPPDPGKPVEWKMKVFQHPLVVSTRVDDVVRFDDEAFMASTAGDIPRDVSWKLAAATYEADEPDSISAQLAFARGARVARTAEVAVGARFVDVNTSKAMKAISADNAILALATGPCRAAPWAHALALSRIGASQPNLPEASVDVLSTLCQLPLALLWGPPGTGKTYQIAATLAGALAAAPSMHVLVCACTHSALEQVEAQLLRRPAVAAHVYRIKTRDDVKEEPIGRYRVVLSTVWQAHRIAEFKTLARYFDLVVFDEASQMPLRHAFMATQLLAPNGRVLVVGDPMQLPPVSKVDWAAPDACSGAPNAKCQLFGSLFDALMWNHRTGERVSQDQLLRDPDLPVHALVKLTESRRCGPSILRFVSVFYPSFPGGLRPAAADPETAQRPLLNHPVAAVMLSTRAQEVQALCDVVAHIKASPQPWLKTVFVVTPHRVQRHAVTRALHRKGLEVLDDDSNGEPSADAATGGNAQAFSIRVDTVDRFQGSEADVVILAYADLNATGFTYSPNRTNVAISRAKHALLLVTAPHIVPPSSGRTPSSGSDVSAARSDETAGDLARRVLHTVYHHESTLSIDLRAADGLPPLASRLAPWLVSQPQSISANLSFWRNWKLWVFVLVCVWILFVCTEERWLDPTIFIFYFWKNI